MSRNASTPINKHNGRRPNSARSDSSVSTVYDGPPRRISRSSTRKPGKPRTASAAMCRRCAALATGARRGGGSAAGTMRGSSSAGARRAACAGGAAVRRIGGGNDADFLKRECALRRLRRAQVAVMNRVEGTAKNTDRLHLKLLADVSVAEHHEFDRGQPFEPDRTTGMQLVGGDANLDADSLLETVGEARRGVDHHRARIDLAQ